MTNKLTAAEQLNAITNKKRHIANFSRVIDGISRRNDRAADALRQVVANPDKFGASPEDIAGMQTRLNEGRRRQHALVELVRDMTVNACGQHYAAALAAQSERAANK